MKPLRERWLNWKMMGLWRDVVLWYCRSDESWGNLMKLETAQAVEPTTQAPSTPVTWLDQSPDTFSLHFNNTLKASGRWYDVYDNLKLLYYCESLLVKDYERHSLICSWCSSRRRAVIHSMYLMKSVHICLVCSWWCSTQYIWMYICD